MKNKFEEIEIDEKELDKQLEDGRISAVQMPQLTSFSEIEKYQFCTEIIKYKKNNQLKQKDVAKIIDVNKSEISKMFSYNLKEFSQERILNFIQALLEHGAKIDMDSAYEKIKKQSARFQKKFEKREIA